MKTTEQLHEYFNNDLKQDITELESKRKSVVASAFIFAGLIVVATVGLNYLLVKVDFNIGWNILVSLIFLTGAVVVFLDRINNRDFYDDFKNRVIERIVKFVDPSFNYISHKYIQPAHLVESKLFSHTPRKYKGDDYVVGTLGGGSTKVEFSEVVAKHKSDALNNDGKTSGNWESTFKGLFFVAQIDTQFVGQTYLVTAGDEATTLLLGNAARPEAVSIEPEFDRHFTVYSTSSAEARGLFSPAIVERLIHFRQKRHDNLRLSFIGQKMYAAFWHEEDLFEPKIYQSLFNFEIIRSYYDDLEQAISVVEEIERGRSVKTHAVAGR
jgi:hypothetical protein